MTRGPLSVLHDAVCVVGAWLAAAALGAIVVSYSWEVAARYFFNAPTEWAHDTVSYLLAAVIFLAVPELTRRGGHVSIPILSNALTGRASRVAGACTQGAAMLVCLGAGWMVVTQVVKQASVGTMTQGTIQVPKAWITGLIAFGLLAMAVGFARHAVSAWRGEN